MGIRTRKNCLFGKCSSSVGAKFGMDLRDGMVSSKQKITYKGSAVSHASYTHPIVADPMKQTRILCGIAIASESVHSDGSETPLAVDPCF
mmetsp:Transcript_17339/g.47823  ORF Transcript_17339/g.47823 Transcript_17339/m.47823 type:complete len:90 (-) Transcript_17339:327-596(-)